MALAIFDLDNTLLAGDSDYSWGQFLVEKGLVDAEIYRQANNKFYEEYQNGTLNIDEFLTFSLTPLTQHDAATLNSLHEEFMRDYIAPMMLPKAQALLTQHKQQGDYLLIITATNGFITRPIAKQLQVDDILATNPEFINDRYTGRYLGTPTFQHGKVTRLHEWLTGKNYSLADAYFYSDSINDLALLEQVGHPVVVDADERLTEVATSRGWKSISLR